MADSLAPTDQLRLTTPASFAAFPFDKPYDIQIDLMRHLYDVIESRSLAMLVIKGLSNSRPPVPSPHVSNYSPWHFLSFVIVIRPLLYLE